MLKTKEYLLIMNKKVTILKSYHFVFNSSNKLNQSKFGEACPLTASIREQFTNSPLKLLKLGMFAYLTAYELHNSPVL